MLIVVGGPMFAGKTTWLLQHAKSLPSEQYVLFKPNIDTRYSKKNCTTHNGDWLLAKNLNINRLRFPKLKPEITTVLIDELNFFPAGPLIKEVKKMLGQGKTVIGAGLIYDAAKKPFGSTLPLTKIADRVIELTAICDGCKKPAKHTYRKIASHTQVIVGAAEIYGACCENCWETLHAK